MVLADKRACWVAGWGDTPKINYCNKVLNETIIICYKATLLSKINPACEVALDPFVLLSV